MMRRLLSVALLSALHVLSFMLAAIGSCFSANSQFWHITFLQLATIHDAKYGPKKSLVVEDDEPTLPGKTVN